MRKILIVFKDLSIREGFELNAMLLLQIVTYVLSGIEEEVETKNSVNLIDDGSFVQTIITTRGEWQSGRFHFIIIDTLLHYYLKGETPFTQILSSHVNVNKKVAIVRHDDDVRRIRNRAGQ